MRLITLSVTPTTAFDVPISTGYSVYGALLARIGEHNPNASEHIHDAEFSSLHNSGLIGPAKHDLDDFNYSHRKHHKVVDPSQMYTIKLGITEPEDEELFDALANSLALSGEPITLTHGELEIAEFQSTETTHEDLVEQCEYDPRSLRLFFETVTGINDGENVTTAFPKRDLVFQSIQQKWNATAPDGEEIDISRKELLDHLIEKPSFMNDPWNCDEQSVHPLETGSVVTRFNKTDDGRVELNHMQGFRGTCEYQFKGAKSEFKQKVVALGKFAQYSGVGKAVSRGCGSVISNITRK